jgi:hypothetical protein
MIHPFFEALDVPLINSRLQLTIRVAGINNDIFYPIMRQTGGDVLNEVAADTTFSVTGASRWVVYHCEFQPETAKKLSAMIGSNKMTKKLNYWQSRYAKSTVPAATLTQDFEIDTGIQAPRRIVAMLFNEADWLSQTSCIPAVTDTRDSLEYSNIEINNQRLYQQNIDSDYEHFKNLQREMFSGEDQNSNGALISYSDFLRGTHRYYVYDISQSEYMIKDPNASVKLRFVGKKKTGSTNCVLHFFTEHEVHVEINMTEGKAYRSGA